MKTPALAIVLAPASSASHSACSGGDPFAIGAWAGPPAGCSTGVLLTLP